MSPSLSPSLSLSLCVLFAICNWQNFRFHAHNSHCVFRLQSTRRKPAPGRQQISMQLPQELEQAAGSGMRQRAVRSCAALKHATIAAPHAAPARTWRLFIMRINILASAPAPCPPAPFPPACPPSRIVFPALSYVLDICMPLFITPPHLCVCVCLPDAACQLPSPDNDVGFSLIFI